MTTRLLAKLVGSVFYVTACFLRSNLEGYEAYTRKVRWRMVPFVW